MSNAEANKKSKEALGKVASVVSEFNPQVGSIMETVVSIIPTKYFLKVLFPITSIAVSLIKKAKGQKKPVKESLSRERIRQYESINESFSNCNYFAMDWDALLDRVNDGLKGTGYSIVDITYPRTEYQPAIVTVKDKKENKTYKFDFDYDGYNDLLTIGFYEKTSRTVYDTQEAAKFIIECLGDNDTMEESFTQRSTIDWAALEREIQREFDQNTTEVYIWEKSDIRADLEVTTDEKELYIGLEYDPYREVITVKGYYDEFYSVDDIIKQIKKELEE